MKVKTPVVQAEREKSLSWALAALVVVGFVIRLAFIRNPGFSTDVQTFEAWGIALAEHGMGSFYAGGGIHDYPPGYFYILSIVGWLWETFFKTSDTGHYVVIQALVKLPAILADLGVGVLLFAIVRRFAKPAVALGAAALYLLNPAIIFNSALWGQVDSVSAGFSLLAVYLLLRGEKDEGPSWWIVGGWLAFGYSLLIKPQAAVLLPLFIAYAFATDPARRRQRIFSSAIGAIAALLLALGLTEPFHPSNPLAAYAWLLHRYEFGSSVYAYNSVNAFNLWSIRGPMWQPDTNDILFFPQYAWGIALVVAALALVVWRYLQDRTARSFLEGCAVATLAFFVLATRMHERYVFDAVVFAIVCLPFARRYLWGAIALTVVLFANLQYSLQYLYDMTNHVANVNSMNLWGGWTTFFSLLAVATFFTLGYGYLGTDPAAAAEDERRRIERATIPGADVPPVGMTPPRPWFDPREGLIGLSKPLDYLVMFGFGILNFVLSFVNYWNPGTKIFDEIYFARAGEEYLKNMRIYEDTHPPLTKLLVTFSMMLFGGMPKGHGLGGWTFLNALIGHASNGDNAFGWRFLDVVFGALVVMLLYAFAKRITGSTIFAAIAALLLTLDGMHFVQSRIATPEGFVIFFSVAAVYAFYRFWIASQVAERPHVDVPEWGFALGALASLAIGYALALGMHALWKFDAAATTIAGVYCACGLYLLARYVVMPRLWGDGKEELTYPDGSRLLRDAHSMVLDAPDGGSIDGRGKVVRGQVSQNDGGVLRYRDADLRIDYARDGSVHYQTPEGDATYVRDEIRVDGKTLASGRNSRLWLILFTVALGALVSSKWYGVMGFGVSFTILILVFAQRLMSLFTDRKRAAWFGNPRGFRLDGALITILFISASVYALVWVPDLLRHAPGDIANVNDVVYRQYSMFEYHDTLKATHPYSSKFFEWPIDWVPVAYYYQDHRKDQTNPAGCCLNEITSMPNPMVLWFGLLAVPWVGVLAWKLRNKGYALIFVAYLMQWLPWAASPRIAFAYHFYVNIPLIAICNAILLQRLWAWAKQRDETMRFLGIAAIGGYVAVVLASFVFFYPILSAYPITWNAWHARMWFPTWIVGPG